MTDKRPPSKAERRLLDILLARQADMQRDNPKLKDPGWARHLGISQGHWSRFKRGERHMGAKFAQQVRKAFPELWRELDDVMFPRDGEAA